MTEREMIEARRLKLYRESGYNVDEAAPKIGMSVNGLRLWLSKNHPDLYYNNIRQYTLRRNRSEAMRTAIEAIRECRGNVEAAAKQLGLSLPSVRNRLGTAWLHEHKHEWENDDASA